ncbi:hypothetical protein K443DRAFT_326912 [Laccaria amethystina LaAM-08-1]|uniref:Uncharacterized protein n=1 Tax=Laccaria amethystina LaAM-08-1 TaxID=1095629 RepID=A0A0C9Y6E4_9AGAR|nr:hypothetical protein K443DRAFT_326912 [Laccaria amethystina LaAM-08-1]
MGLSQRCFPFINASRTTAEMSEDISDGSNMWQARFTPLKTQSPHFQCNLGKEGSFLMPMPCVQGTRLMQSWTITGGSRRTSSEARPPSRYGLNKDKIVITH